MVSIATIGPKGSHAWQAARQYNPDATIRLFPNLVAVFKAFSEHETDLALAPVYNTHEGQVKEYSRLVKGMDKGFWQDNIVLPIHLSLGTLTATEPITMLLGKSGVLRQCEDYITSTYPDATLTSVHDLDAAVREIKEQGLVSHGVIEAEEALRAYGLTIRAREIAPHNRTRYAVLGPAPAPRTGYDATTMITTPIKDRVGILVELLSEFTKRSINLIDMQTETDPLSQELQFYIEFEGHLSDERVRIAIERIEHQIIQEPGSVRVLGSFPRVDMRVKRIKTFGFIGSGDMSLWFAERLKSEGYETMITGRSSVLRPEEMIPQVEVVVICVPISATPAAIIEYAPLLAENQALILLAGEAENVLQTALSHSKEGVEVLLVHNLWGPQAATMKDKNASVVRTVRSGVLSSEFEAFLYKHGAKISLDAPGQHDLMMGVSQKLPTSISVALAMALKENNIPPEDIGSHATLTSLYSILSMARVHSQNPRTYGEIMSTSGQGGRIVTSFAENLKRITELAESGDIEALCGVIEENRRYLGEGFLKDRMQQALAVDATLGRVLNRD
ncbi:prephenate dehydratase domain-containing protein [Thiovibrio frasassiensis]|uniref:Prephenate dehydrogenase n=1 Tax=Thiovibrio frasassiensis TaxID=2984131 RepID=A0A9X4MEH7_9BACT|nr:prephenate dehydratase domain-containing protein [Thiovibrio frasassiensis]MDG4474615.1 prephenate dehydrogenase/arogenate dehydrogenase family protein [Thiovibrio frasassiensis]